MQSAKRWQYRYTILNIRQYENMKYIPEPINTSEITLPDEIQELTELLARNTHEVWAANRSAGGWIYGKIRDDSKKHHPCLVPYDDLPETEKDYDRKTALETLKLILHLGYKIEK